MGGQALMESGEPAELEGGVSRDELRSAMSALAVITALLLLAGLITAVVLDRRHDDGVSIGTLRAAAGRVSSARSLHLRMDFEIGSGPPGVFTADLDNATQHGRLTINVGGTYLSGVTDGVNLYFAVPMSRQASTDGKTCVFSDGSQGGEAGGPDPVASAQSGKAMLESLAGASGEVRDLGTDDLDGVATHHYSVNVDLAEAMITVPYEVWLDGDDVIRQVRVDVSTAGMRGHTNVRFDPSDEPVAVEIPGPDECYKADNVMEAVALASS